MLILQADRDSLLKPLQAVTGIVERRHTLPILSNVLLESKDGQTKLLATDLEIQINTPARKAQAGDFRITTNAKKIPRYPARLARQRHRFARLGGQPPDPACRQITLCPANPACRRFPVDERR